VLDAKFNISFVGSSDDGKIKHTPITDGLEKGYAYAGLFFYDEVTKEMDKLMVMIKKIREDVRVEFPEIDIPITMLEISKRVRDAVGDDSLDLMIKEVLAEESRHIALMAEDSEKEKLENIRNAILTETIANLFDTVYVKAETLPDRRKSFKFSQSYIESLTERQRKLIAPALKIAGFINRLKLDSFELLDDWSARYTPVPLAEGFKEKEDIIKANIKKMMAT
jgi:hypothetical protein